VNHAELDRLVIRVQEGNRDAFADVVFLIRRELRIFLSAHAGSIDMIEDVLQYTLVTCYENIAKYEPRGTFLAWVKGIARNLLLKELNARSRCVPAEDDFLERIMAESSLASAQGNDNEEETVEHLRECLAKLPDHSRTMIQQRYFNRLSVREMAKLNQRTETWTAVTLFRIRETLRECMSREATP
jgi:RNA polymerase sigma-70 factor (ECF subfamily)